MNNAFTRRAFLLTSASAAGLAVLNRSVFGQMSSPGLSSDPAAAALSQYLGRQKLLELEGRFRMVNDDICARGLRSIPGVTGTFLTGYPYNEFYDWDLYFENLYLSYFGVWPYCFTNLKAFLDRQAPDGYINRSLIKQRDRQHFKPFLAQLAVLGCRQNGNDYGWLRGNYYVRLKKYLDKWFSYDGDGNGLPTWNSADAAGTDNQWSRAGALASFTIEGSDLASYLVRELRAMAVIARSLNESADAKEFDARADRVCELINRYFWDDADGMYYDRDERNGHLVKVKSATCFMPLFAGAATPERAKRIVEEHILNEKEFWLAYPIASYAKTEPDYYQGSHHECNWRGPTWAPTNYMAFQDCAGTASMTPPRSSRRGSWTWPLSRIRSCANTTMRRPARGSAKPASGDSPPSTTACSWSNSPATTRRAWTSPPTPSSRGPSASSSRRLSGKMAESGRPAAGYLRSP